MVLNTKFHRFRDALKKDEKNLSSNVYKYRSREQEKKHANKLRILQNKFPEQSIVKTFGSRPVVLDNVIRMPKINIYKVDEAFLEKKK